MNGGMQGGYPPPAPMRRQGKNGVLLWSLVGCGIIAILIVVVVGVTASKVMKNTNTKGMFSVFSAMTPAAEGVEKVGASLEDYRKDHGGKYPPTLDALIPKYISDKSAFAVGNSDDPKQMEYTVPKADALDTVVVVRVHIGDIVMPTQRQQMYVCLLKDGEIASEQQVRTVLSKYGRRLTEHKRTY